MQRLVHFGTTLALLPLLAWACSSGEPTPSEPLAKTNEALAWSGTSNTMTSARANYGAASLGDANGRVLVCGGHSASATVVASCDIYDPTTNAWSAGPTLPETRGYPTLSALGPNSVLVAGGLGSATVTTAIAGTASAWGSAEAITGRYEHTASVLSGGTVLLTGGFDAAVVSGAQRRVAGTWSAAGTQGRYAHAAAVINSGTQVLVTGGLTSSTPVDTAAIYTASSNSWAATNPMVISGVSSPRKYHTATLLPDGTVLIVGGQGATSADFPTTAIRFNPSSGAWSDAGTITARALHSAALVNGFVIIAGGRNSGGSSITSVQSYNPTTNTWADLEPLGTARADFTLVPLPGGKLLAAGGISGTGSTFLNTAEVFAPGALNASCPGGSASQCVSGYCADGVCCDVACTGQCQACAESGSGGTCISVSGPPRGSRSACAGGFVCTSGSCPTSCSSDSQCGSAYYCNSANPRVCTPRGNQGAGCGAQDQCNAGLTCTDNVCCNAPCGGQCQHCDNTGACVPTSGAAISPRAACASSGVCGAVCNGMDTTQCLYPDSNTLCQAASCSNGHALLAAGCNQAGGCLGGSQDCPPYVCNAAGTACRTTCTLDTHCSTGNFCDGGSCAPLRNAGDDCTLGTQCASTFCVNSVCCGSSSCPSGSSCSIPNHRGVCRRNIGTGCSGDSQCGSDHCADSVCCDVGCTGQCEHCDAGPSNSPGTCTATLGAPAGSRSVCGGQGAGTTCGAVCDGSNRDACTLPGSSTTCGTASCADGLFTTAAQCDGGGTCPDTSGDCGAYACDSDGLACNTACSSAAECAAGYICDANVCVPIPGLGDDCMSDAGCESGHCVDKVCCGTDSCPSGSACNLPNHKGTCKVDRGSKCTSNAACDTAHCVDGFCCNSSCDSQCEACNNAGEEGTCSPVLGAPQTPRAACDGPTGSCGAQCDGTDRTACAFPDAGSSCGDKSCDSGVETRTGTCDGKGKCSAPTHDCDAYVCNKDGTACNTSCAKAADCAVDYFCSNKECIPNLKTGRDCEVDAACASGHCVDAVCCSRASCDKGSTCAYAGQVGDCVKDDGTDCSIDDDCGSGFCVDGLCCDSKCDGQCEACDLPKREGTCSPVSGDPHGTRDACSTGDGLCGVRTCNGAKDTTQCVGYANGTDVECAAASCSVTDFTPASTCSGAGKCQTPSVSSCIPFRCADDGCLSACSDNTSCADGYHCKDHDCVADGATCSTDRSQSIPIEGPPTACAPYLCTSDGTCASDCQKSTDCAAGNACDTSASPGVCRPVTGANAASAAAKDSGCGCRVPTHSSAGGAWWLVLTLGTCAAALRRRRTVAPTSGGRRSRSASARRARAPLCSTRGTA